MSETTTAPAAEAATAGSSAPEPAAEPVAQPDAQPAQRVEDLPDWAQKILKDTRAEAASHRTKATTAEQAQAATLEKIAVALGLKPDETAPDPAQLTEQLTQTQVDARTAKVELAVFRSAAQAGADAESLLDSRSFLTKVAALDPTADGFTASVATAITEAVAANPKLKAVQATGASSVDHSAGGPGEKRTGKTASLEDAIAARMAAH